MTATEILKLIDAGFTRDDILKLDTGAPIVPGQQPPEPKQEEPKGDPKPTPEPKTDPDPQPAPVGVTLSDDQFKKLLQQLNVQGASLDVPPDQDMGSKLAEHFKEITIGK